MVLGIEHLHEDQDILAISGWEALLDGLGYSTEDLQESIKPRKVLDINEHCIERIRRLRIAYELISKEEMRLSELNERKRVVKIKAETEARQQGMGISETVEIGKKRCLRLKM